MDAIMSHAYEFVSEQVQRRLGGDDDDDPYAVLKGDLFGDTDSPDPWRIVVSAILILTFGSLAAGAGVGGGGLFVPIYAILLGVGGKPAVPLSKCTILGAAIGNMVSIAWAKHPKAQRPLIDYEVSTLMQAGELLGVTLGVMLNLILPEVVIMIFLAVLLSYNALRTLRKGRSKYRAETAAFAKAAKAELQQQGQGGAVELSPRDSSMARAHQAHLSALDQSTADLRAFLENEASMSAAAILKFQQYGVDSVGDLSDEHIINDAVLRSEIGLSEEEVVRLKAAVARRVAEDEAALAPDLNALNFSQDLSGQGEESKVEGGADMNAIAGGGGEGTLCLDHEPSPDQDDDDKKKEEEKEEGEEGKVARMSPELQALYDDAAAQFPVWAWVAVVAMTAFTILYALIKKDVLNPCYGKGSYWAWNFTPVPVLGAAMFAIAVYLNKIHERRAELGYEYLSTDIQFTKEQLLKFPVTALNAGLAAGLLGIGGGMVIGPLFIEIGMEPQVGTSSCAYMILWTAISGVVQYYYAGKLGWKFGLFFLGLGFISGQLGQRGVSAVLKKSGRPSVVVLLLGAIIGLACVVMTISTAVDIASTSESASQLFALELEWTTCGYTKSH